MYLLTGTFLSKRKGGVADTAFYSSTLNLTPFPAQSVHFLKFINFSTFGRNSEPLPPQRQQSFLNCMSIETSVSFGTVADCVVNAS